MINIDHGRTKDDVTGEGKKTKTTYRLYSSKNLRDFDSINTDVLCAIANKTIIKEYSNFDMALRDTRSIYIGGFTYYTGLKDESHFYLVEHTETIIFNSIIIKEF